MTFDLAQMIADMEAGTPGEWGMKTVRTQCGVCHQIGPWPHKWRAGTDMSACIYDDYPSPPVGTDTMLANARRIARVPLLEAEIIRLTARVERLEQALGVISRGETYEFDSDLQCVVVVSMCEDEMSEIARAALSTHTEEIKL